MVHLEKTTPEDESQPTQQEQPDAQPEQPDAQPEPPVQPTQLEPPARIANSKPKAAPLSQPEQGSVTDEMPLESVKKRGRPRKPPASQAPKPEPKKRGRPPKLPEASVRAEPPTPISLDAYDREMMRALLAHSRTSISQREDRWRHIVKF